MNSCTQWLTDHACGSTDQVRLFIQGHRCATCAPPQQPTPDPGLCTGCGFHLHPAATVGNDGTPNAFDRHPGCQPGGQQLRLIKGARK